MTEADKTLRIAQGLYIVATTMPRHETILAIKNELDAFAAQAVAAERATPPPIPRVAEDNLPDCMMPDGADPCRGYQRARDTIEILRDEIRALRAERAKPVALDDLGQPRSEWAAENIRREQQRPWRHTMNASDGEIAADIVLDPDGRWSNIIDDDARAQALQDIIAAALAEARAGQKRDQPA